MMRQMYIKRYSNPNPGKIEQIADVIEDEIMPNMKAKKARKTKRKDGRTSYVSKKKKLKVRRYST